MRRGDLRSLLAGPVLDVAPRLLGMLLVSLVDGTETAVELREVEAYDGSDDPASHAFGGPTARNRSMYGEAGVLYVYRSYGVHWCCNVVTGPRGKAAAVLLRGGVPARGLEEMMRRRGRRDHLADGPGKLCAALGITGAHDGLDLLAGGTVRLLPGEERPYVTSPRIGISKALERPWRFLAGDGTGRASR